MGPFHTTLNSLYLTCMRVRARHFTIETYLCAAL